jgi:hypothetical protein
MYTRTTIIVRILLAVEKGGPPPDQWLREFRFSAEM